MRQQIIHLHPEAPAKPDHGTRCNGCGVCCTATPCPLGLLAGSRPGDPCRLLRWQAAERRYACGAVDDPATAMPWLPKSLAALFRRLALRWIAAGKGCDARVEVEPASPSV
jgi:hypothetical protein